jgi:hypothetical protein
MSLDFQCGKNYKKSESDDFVASQILTDSSIQKCQYLKDLQTGLQIRPCSKEIKIDRIGSSWTPEP